MLLPCVFAPKYRRKVFYETKRLEIGQILRQLCNWYGANLLEAEACSDHIHILVEIPPKHSVSSFMGYLKGKSSIMIYNKWGKSQRTSNISWRKTEWQDK